MMDSEVSFEADLDNISQIDVSQIDQDDCVELEPDFQHELVIDDNADEVNHLEEAIVNKTQGNVHVDGLISMICTLACAGIVDTVRTGERLLLAETRATEILENWPVKEEATEVMQWVNPDNPKKWSVAVVDAWKQFLNKTDQADHTARGKAIWKQFDAAKTDINNFLNPLWPDKLKSGTNESAVLDAILRNRWADEV
jgi:hypothetical protein